MQIDYDPEADAIYVRFREGEVEETREVGKNIYVVVDSNGSPPRFRNSICQTHAGN
jgi:uncharacterized protein YuzE